MASAEPLAGPAIACWAALPSELLCHILRELPNGTPTPFELRAVASVRSAAARRHARRVLATRAPPAAHARARRAVARVARNDAALRQSARAPLGMCICAIS
jgi:hypothetical protein